VRDLLERQEARELARSAIAMLHALRKQVVVEGVELQAQRDWLADWGADLLQGWLFSQSLPGQDFAEYVRRSPVVAVAGGQAVATEGPQLLRPAPASVGLAGQAQPLEQPLELLRP
jgi:predicted signal transduction protein with EAL and GGDEF domain